MYQLENGMKEINNVASEVNGAIMENTKGVTQVAESSSHLNSIMQGNMNMVNENVALNDQLSSEVNKFVCE